MNIVDALEPAHKQSRRRRLAGTYGATIRNDVSLRGMYGTAVVMKSRTTCRRTGRRLVCGACLHVPLILVAYGSPYYLHVPLILAVELECRDTGIDI